MACEGKTTAAPSAFLCVQVAGVVVGMGFRFGYKASGDTETLLSLGQHYGLSVSVVDLVAETGTLKVQHQMRMSPTRLLLPALELLSPCTAAPCSCQATTFNALGDEAGILFRRSFGAGRGRY